MTPPDFRTPPSPHASLLNAARGVPVNDNGYDARPSAGRVVTIDDPDMPVWRFFFTGLVMLGLAALLVYCAVQWVGAP